MNVYGCVSVGRFACVCESPSCKLVSGGHERCADPKSVTWGRERCLQHLAAVRCFCLWGFFLYLFAFVGPAASVKSTKAHTTVTTGKRISYRGRNRIAADVSSNHRLVNFQTSPLPLSSCLTRNVASCKNMMHLFKHLDAVNTLYQGTDLTNESTLGLSKSLRNRKALINPKPPPAQA